MPAKDDHTITEYQRFINTVAADTEVVKIVLTALLARLSQARGVETLDDLQSVTRLALERNAPDEAGGQLAKRLHILTLAQHDEYFRKLRAVVLAMADAPPNDGTPLN